MEARIRGDNPFAEEYVALRLLRREGAGWAGRRSIAASVEARAEEFAAMLPYVAFAEDDLALCIARLERLVGEGSGAVMLGGATAGECALLFEAHPRAGRAQLVATLSRPRFGPGGYTEDSFTIHFGVTAAAISAFISDLTALLTPVAVPLVGEANEAGA